MTKNQLEKFKNMFDYEFYKSNYSDIKSLEREEAINHYLKIGKKEGRVVSQKHAQFLTNSEDFNILSYKYERGLSELSLREVCIHYMTYGKQNLLLNEIAEKIIPIPDEKESNTHDVPKEVVSTNITSSPTEAVDPQNQILEQINKPNNDQKRICIIYSYYEKKNQNKNQSNLSYFLRYGMDEKLWKEMDITLLLIINGCQCEVNIPNKDNIIVWEREYDQATGGRDIGTYRKGIEFMENKHKKPFFMIFDYLFITNSSSTGPFWNIGKNNHWLDPFINKMEKENSVLCSPVINFIPASDAGGPGPRAQTYCALIKMDFVIYKLLLQTFISRLAPGSTNKEMNKPPHQNRVFDVHLDTASTILFGEYGMSRVLLENGLNISSLIYSNVNYQDKSSWQKFPDRIDRNPHFRLEFLKKCVFIKNNWNVSDTIYDSVPVFYGKTSDLMNRNLNMKNFIDEAELSCEMDYENLPLSKTGKYRGKESLFFSDRSKSIKWMKWNSKKEHYLIFGKANQVHLFPKQKQSNSSAVIYTHYHNKNIVPDYVIQGLKTLMFLNYDILFYTACDTINVDLPFQVYYRAFPDDVSITDRHQIMFSEAILKTKLIKYDYILSLNDTLIFPIHGIQNMKQTIENLRKEENCWMLFDNNEKINTSFCEFSKKSIPFLKQFLTDNTKNDSQNINFEHIFSKNNISFKKIVDNSTLCSSEDYMKNPECFGIKKEDAGNLFFNNDEQSTNNMFNFLTRYLG